MCSQHRCMLQAEAKAWRGEVETVTRCGHLAGEVPAPQQYVRWLLSLAQCCNCCDPTLPGMRLVEAVVQIRLFHGPIVSLDKGVGVQVLTRTGAWPSTRESTSTGTGAQPVCRPGHLTDCLPMHMQPVKMLLLAVTCGQ